ncbi:MAG: hypothetical protein ACKKL5_03895 [Candidatus Komeilibacteria bacterium]
MKKIISGLVLVGIVLNWLACEIEPEPKQQISAKIYICQLEKNKNGQTVGTIVFCKKPEIIWRNKTHIVDFLWQATFQCSIPPNMIGSFNTAALTIMITGLEPVPEAIITNITALETAVKI